MKLSPLTIISPIDGRYHKYTNSLRNIFSEFGLFKFRVQIEIYWLQKLASIETIKEIPPFTEIEHNFLNQLITNFNLQDAKYIKKIEHTTQHDLKAVEYFLKEKIKKLPNLHKINEFIHFACTSEDINNLSYGLMWHHTKNKIILPVWKKIINNIQTMSATYKNISFISRTHGQPATPSTIGKEMANFAYRLIRQYRQFKSIKILGKMNGTVGNYNAHVIAYPEINWRKISEEFVTSLGIAWNPYTTQIEPHDYIAELSDCISRFNTILINFNRDIWHYMTLEYFKKKTINTDEIGSSVMPYKVNPINFENSEGNLGLSNAIFNHFSNKLPISRGQRDLSDSTILRNLGVSIGYSLIAYQNVIQGMNTLILNQEQISRELNQNWVVLSEAIQTVMRKYNIHHSYEITKKFVLHSKNTPETIKKFIESLSLPITEKTRLKKMTPTNYIGLASDIAHDISQIKL